MPPLTDTTTSISPPSSTPVGDEVRGLVEGARVNATDKRFREDISKVDLSNYLFVRLVANKRRFSNVDFKYTIFDTCYIRNWVFDSCNFTGCRFVGTNLHGSSFTGCIFDYVNFERTLIDDDIIEAGCPAVENLKMRFARTLRMNYQQIGDAKAANKAISVELAATELHLLKSWSSRESYYRKKFQGWRRFRVFLSWVDFRLLDIVWGNGESLLKLVRTTVAIILLMTFIDVIWFRDANALSSYLLAFFDAPTIFFGVYSPDNYSKLYLCVLIFIRLVMVGFFMSIIIKRFNRR